MPTALQSWFLPLDPMRPRAGWWKDLKRAASRVAGAVVGGLIGGPAGAVVGQELAGRLYDAIAGGAGTGGRGGQRAPDANVENLLDQQLGALLEAAVGSPGGATVDTLMGSPYQQQGAWYYWQLGATTLIAPYALSYAAPRPGFAFLSDGGQWQSLQSVVQRLGRE